MGARPAGRARGRLGAATPASMRVHTGSHTRVHTQGLAHSSFGTTEMPGPHSAARSPFSFGRMFSHRGRSAREEGDDLDPRGPGRDLAGHVPNPPGLQGEGSRGQGRAALGVGGEHPGGGCGKLGERRWPSEAMTERGTTARPRPAGRGPGTGAPGAGEPPPRCAVEGTPAWGRPGRGGPGASAEGAGASR